MIDGRSVAAVVPARGGSKGIKDKNIRPLAGVPLIGHTLDCINKSGVIDYFAVSTESQRIAEVARTWTENIIWRPPDLASDTASGIDVIAYAIEHIKRTVGGFDYFLYLQPTSPLRIAEDIVGSLRTAISRGARFVVSVCECEHNPLLANTLPEDHSLEGFISKAISRKNRQQTKMYYRVNGAIYVVSGVVKKIDLYGSSSYAYIMPQERSIDIDTEFDFRLAEALLSYERDSRS